MSTEKDQGPPMDLPVLSSQAHQPSSPPPQPSKAFETAMKAANALCLDSESLMKSNSGDQVALRDASMFAVELQQHLSTLRIMLTRGGVGKGSSPPATALTPNPSVVTNESSLLAGQARRATDIFVAEEGSQTINAAVHGGPSSPHYAGSTPLAPPPTNATVTDVAALSSSTTAAPPRSAFQLSMLLQQLAEDAEALLTLAAASPRASVSSGPDDLKRIESRDATVAPSTEAPEADAVDRPPHDNNEPPPASSSSPTEATQPPFDWHDASNLTQPSWADPRSGMESGSPRNGRRRLVHIDPSLDSFDKNHAQRRLSSTGTDSFEPGSPRSTFFMPQSNTSSSWLCGSVSFVPSGNFQPDEANLVSRGTMTHMTMSVSTASQCVRIPLKRDEKQQ